MTDNSNVELLAAVAVEARTRAVGWLVVLAAFVAALVIGGTLQQVGTAAGIHVLAALGLLAGMTATVAVITTLIPLARAGWTYRTAKAALLSEVNS